MNVTESVRAIVLQGLRNKKETRAWLSEKVGQNKSWATRFFAGEVKSLSDEQVEMLQTALDIRFFAMNKAGQYSPAALDFASEFDRNEAFASVTGALRDAMAQAIYTPRYIATQDMAAVGEKIIAICKANPDKPGKVARLVLELLA